MSDGSAAPIIVLVHGAFADASGWAGVYTKLKDDGHTVLAPPNPLRGVAVDAAYLQSFVEQLEGPVLLVGHSYGGAVITVAGDAEQVVGLVYVAGFAPDKGENLGDLQARFPDSRAVPNYRPASIPDDGVEFSLNIPTFPEVFAADVAPELAQFMAIAQRPISAAAFTDEVSVAAWSTKPSWAVFPTADGAIHPDVHRFCYERAGATVVEVEGSSHAVMVSHPDVVADTIREAIETISLQPTV